MFSGCHDPQPFKVARKNQPLTQLKDPIQTASFDLRASYTGEIIATGISFSSGQLVYECSSMHSMIKELINQARNLKPSVCYGDGFKCLSFE